MRKTVKTHSKAWQMDNRVYSIQDIPLNKPLEGWDIVTAFLFLLVAWKIEIIIPPVVEIHPIIRYVALPIGLTMLMHKIPMDGKKPLKYIFGMVNYLLTKRIYIEHFQRQTAGQNQKIRVFWYCSRGLQYQNQPREEV